MSSFLSLLWIFAIWARSVSYSGREVAHAAWAGIRVRRALEVEVEVADLVLVAGDAPRLLVFLADVKVGFFRSH